MLCDYVKKMRFLFILIRVWKDNHAGEMWCVSSGSMFEVAMGKAHYST